VSRNLAALLLVTGIVLLPLRAVVATTPTFIAYDVAVRSNPTRWPDGFEPLASRSRDCF
jgi:hypothetical protein